MSSELSEPKVDPNELRLARERNEQRLKERAIAAIQESEASASFARSLGISEQELWEMQTRGEVIGFSVGTLRFYPKIQVREGRVAEEIIGLQVALGSDVPGFISWTLKPNGLLEGQTPSDALAEGKIEAVTTAAINSNPQSRM